MEGTDRRMPRGARQISWEVGCPHASSSHTEQASQTSLSRQSPSHQVEMQILIREVWGVAQGPVFLQLPGDVETLVPGPHVSSKCDGAYSGTAPGSL